MRRGGGRACGIGEAGWDAVLRGTAHCPAALPSLARLRARPAEARWRAHRPALNADPLVFADDLMSWQGCSVRADGCLGGFGANRLGFRSESAMPDSRAANWAACMACVDSDTAAASAGTTLGE